MTRPASPRKRFCVFEFGEEDERVEKTSERLLGKFGNPKPKKICRRRKLLRQSSPVDKYEFLERFAACSRTLEKEIGNDPINVDDEPIDVGIEAYTGTLEKESRNDPVDVDDEPIDVCSDEGTNTPSRGICNPPVDIDINGVGDCRQYCVTCPVSTLQEENAVKNEISGVDTFVLSGSSIYETEQVGAISNDDDQIETNSSTPVSALAKKEVSLEEYIAKHGSVGHEIDFVNKAVIVFPDFILFGDLYCTQSCLTFSRCCIKVEGSTVNGEKGTFNAEWPVGDIVNFESEWCEVVETAIVNIHFKSEISKGEEYANKLSGIKLKFSVYDPHWYEGQEAIKSLDIRYRDIWNLSFDTYKEYNENAFPEHDLAISKSSLHFLGENFGEIIYPRGDPDAVTISKRDVELLQPDTFINDTIIDFYIKYLKNKIQPEYQHRFHFFNSFFFRKLADLDKDPSSAYEGRAAFQRVHKWTRKVNIFEKDYIFIPVNYSLHWSLIVICHPGEVAYFRDDESEKSHKVPCILHMDSIRGSHWGLKNLVQSYLYEEWKERHKEAAEDVTSKFLDLRFVLLELPQQENSFDCGLFLLHYVELFLEEAPLNFSPFKITKSSNFLNRNWFLPGEASLKRAQIQKLIYELFEDQPQKASLQVSTDIYHCSQFLGSSGRETGREFFGERCSGANACQGCSPSSYTDLGIGISLSVVSPPSVVQGQINGLRMKSKELFDPGNSGRWQTAANHWNSFLLPIEEAEGHCEQVTNSSSDAEDCWHTTGLATESPATSYFCKDFTHLGTSWNWNRRQIKELNEDNLSSGTSTSGSEKSSEIGVEEEYFCPEFDGCDQESSSTSIEDLAACGVEDSEEADSMHNDG